MDVKSKLSIGEVCKILGCEQHNLRYIEKALELNIERENNIERSYSVKDVETLKMVFDLKEQGLNYKAIKRVLEKGEEVAVTYSSVDIVEDTTDIIPINYEEMMEKFKDSIEKVIYAAMNSALNSAIEQCIITKLEPIETGIISIQKENEELKSSLEEIQEKHFREIDDKLMAWREEQKIKNKRKSFFSRFFG